MHPNEQGIERLYTSPSRHRPLATAECNHPAARFACAAIRCLLLAFLGVAIGAAQQVALLTPVRPNQCKAELTNCQDFDALVFVHGLYGNDASFRNDSTGFDWPREVPAKLGSGSRTRPVDVFRLDYRTALLGWAATGTPDFETVANAVFEAMKTLRVRQYRSIGLVAHSLGGNVISTYIHMVNSRLGHPQRSQHAFVITLATPVLGAQIADIASVLRSALHMNDPLLDSLRKGNLYLTMLREFRSEETEKEGRYVCRPVHLYAAYEEKYLGPLLVVTPDSAASSITRMVNGPIVGFPLDHIQIAKPPDSSSPVYKWAMDLINEEYIRLATWDEAQRALPPANRLCEHIAFVPE